MKPSPAIQPSRGRTVRSRSHESITEPPIRMSALLEHPEFKRLVEHQANLICKQAVRDGHIRVLRKTTPPVFIPRMDIVDDMSSPRLVATFELPGVRNDEVTLQVKENGLVVEGQRRPRITRSTLESTAGSQQSNSGEGTSSPNVISTANRHHNIRVPVQELRYGRFNRLIPLPPGTKPGDIVARFQDGMLIVTWPRSSISNTDIEMSHGPKADSTTAPIESNPVQGAENDISV